MDKLASFDLFSVIDAEIDSKGLVDHHLASINDFYNVGLKEIITKVFQIEKEIDNFRDNTAEDKEITKIHVIINFTDVFLSHPTFINYHSGKEQALFPKTAILEDKTYSANLKVNATIKATAYLKNGSTKVRDAVVKDIKLCRMPIMVKSMFCNTHNCPYETLIRMEEDPQDPGGYFIVKGVEWVIDCIESILFNQIQIFHNEGHGKEVYHCQFISKPGDTYQNSDYLIVRWLNDNQLTCEIARDKMANLQLPFYVVFRALGWTTDREIADNIVWGDYDTDIAETMIIYLKDAFNAKYSVCAKTRAIYDQVAIQKSIVDELKADEFAYLMLDTKPENYHQAIKTILRLLDINFLPHIGLTEESRPMKLRFLCLIIRKIFLVNMGNLQPTDRDSYKSKRIHAAGVSYAKTFKTHFNAATVQQIKRRATKDFKAMSFSQVDLASMINSSIHGGDFERLIIQSITSGNKTQLSINMRRKITNRLTSQLLSRKNQISVYSTLRQVTTISTITSKQAERAHEMRRGHNSFLGYICLIHSPEGEKVGLNKQISISASVCGAESSEVIKDKLRNDPLFISLNKLTHKQLNSLSNIYVNGDWIGCTENSTILLEKYRKLRRNVNSKEISPLTTIYWDNTQDEVYFWCDVGRMTRPLLIVYNNHRDVSNEESEAQGTSKSKKQPSSRPAFEQGIRLTQKHIDDLYAKKIGIEDLLKEQIIEYVSPEEQENYYICPSLEQLVDDRNNELREYTHCDIPQAQLGLTALTCPYGNHNQTTRLTYQTNQVRQTCGHPTLNWPFRADKDTFLQYRNEMPLVKTVSNRYLYPSGSNVILAIMCNTSYNIEDSVVISQGAVDRGLFDGCKFTFYKTELDQKEDFGVPDISKTMDIKSANYEKLNNKGFISVGTFIEKGDAIIGKYVHLPKATNEKWLYADRSIIYKEDEPAWVHNVIESHNEDDEKFVKVILRKERPMIIGDKISNRSGQKSICAMLMRDSDMPFTKDGLKPSIIFNSHGIPSRMKCLCE
jgi:DNA-directed RNA polymerase beta subunit